MDTALDEIAFLANSENRVAVLETLVETPLRRDELRDTVDASRVTIARILRELEARAWIERSGPQYTATHMGSWVCTEFTHLADEMAAEHRLRDALQWIPADLLTFDIHHLRNAELSLVDESDATAFIRRLAEFHRSGARIRGIARECAPEVIETHWEITVAGDTHVELVLTPEIVDAIQAHPPSARRFQEMLAAENTRYLVYDDIPMSVGIVDGAVGINLTDEHGVLRGGLKVEDDVVYDWAVELFERYRNKASPVEPATLTV